MIKNCILKRREKVSLFLAVFVISGIFGFLYETLFYRIQLGYWVKRGTTMGPWIPIYGFGGVFLTIFVSKFRKKSFWVFVFSGILCGFLEFITGYLLFHLEGIRLWDYNIELWNFGNLGGYVCLRSVCFFGLSGLLLIEWIIPLCQFLRNKYRRIFLIVCVIFSFLFLFDFILCDVI